MHAAALDVDATLGRYRIVQRIAQGGMASVYLAQSRGAHGFEKWVAIKVIHPHLAAERKFVEMFLDEARIFAPLHHPNVCAILDFGEEDTLPYLVMEYLHGETLSAVVRRARSMSEGLPLGIAARVVAEAARGLHSAHELRGEDRDLLGVVHRDVSPQNVFVLYDGGVKVVDFGIARARNRLTTTVPGEFKGKLAYSAPELVGSDPVDRRADVFSLGVILWESLTLRRLFRRRSEAETLNAVLTHAVPKLSQMGVTVPAPLQDAVARALERDPDKRQQTAKILGDELEAVLYGLGTPWGASQITTWMQSGFSERIDTTGEMLRPSGTSGVDHPRAELPASSSSFISGLRRKRPSQRVLALVAGGVLAVGLLAWVVGRPDPPVPLRAVPLEPGRIPAPPPPVAPPRPAAAARQPVERPLPRAPAEALPTEAASEEPPAADPASAAEPTGPGFLNLVSVPNADVYLGPRRLGRTPLLRVSLPVGRQRLRIRPLDGRRPTIVTVDIRSGRVTMRSLRLP